MKTPPLAYAVEKASGATDDYKGMPTTAQYDFPLPEIAGITLGGAIAGELLDYGDYYDATKSSATWLRIELTASF